MDTQTRDLESAAFPAREFVPALASGLMTRVYQWMALGLAATGATALALQAQPTWVDAILSGSLRWVLIFGLVVMAVALQGYATRMSAPVAFGVFFSYSVLMGVSLTPIFWTYTGGSIALTFFATAGMFAFASVYGYVTRRDLTRFRGFLYMGVVGLILATLVNAFVFGFHNAWIYWLTTYAGIVIFLGLAAYDTQRIQRMAEAAGGRVTVQLAIQCATILYLDFVNLFIYALRVFGRRRD